MLQQARKLAFTYLRGQWLKRRAQRIRLSDQRLFIEEIAPAYAEDRWAKRRRIATELESLRPWLERGPVLELGSGAGVVLSVLREWNVDAVGVEFTRQMIAQACLKEDTLPMVQADGFRLPFADASFPVVLLWGNTLGPLPREINRHLLLKEAARVMIPDGVLALSVRNRFSSLGRAAQAPEFPFRYHARQADWSSSQRGYNRSYGILDLEEVLARAGLQIDTRLTSRKDASLAVIATRMQPANQG